MVKHFLVAGKILLDIFMLLIVLGSLAFGLDKLVIHRRLIVPVTGTGSMYPTFPKGTSDDPDENRQQTVATPEALAYPNGFKFLDNVYFRHTIERGDIVTFTKENYSDDAYIKRVVGLPGEKLEIRNGIININDKPLIEPYTSQAHSTFGGTFIPECRISTIPTDSYVVLGDNRKESDDSRFDLEFIKFTDIDGVITNEMQEKQNLKASWRKDTSLDLDNSTKIQLDGDRLVELINNLRSKSNVSLLTRNSLLDQSTVGRGTEILRTGEFDFDGGKKSKSAKTIMEGSGYKNIVYGEIPVQGYYTAEELMNNFLQFEDSKEFILNPEFDDIGVGFAEGLLNNCPTKIVVIHFGGYIPPDYSVEVKNSWKELLNNLEEIEPSWEKLEEFDEFYSENEDEIDRINQIIDIRIEHSRSITETFEKNQWLSPEQELFMKQEESLSKEQNELAEKINSRR